MEAFQAGKTRRRWKSAGFGPPDAQGARTYFSMARIYRKTGQKEEAIRCYEKILELVPEGRSAESARRPWKN